MKRYIGTKIVAAEPMEHHAAVLAGIARGTPTIKSDGHSDPGYKVLYEDNYVSWSPKDVFERCYREITDSEAELVAAGLAC